MLENNQKELILLKDLGIRFPVNTFTKKRRFGLFKCFCGKEFETQMSNIKNGHTKSCGCYKSKLISEKNRITKKIHGMANHRLYGTWKMMIHRCINQKNISYKNYGGRGITVCDRWKNFNNFIEDMFPTFQEGLTLDRKNNDLGYSVDNCVACCKQCNVMKLDYTVDDFLNKVKVLYEKWFSNEEVSMAEAWSPPAS